MSKKTADIKMKAFVGIQLNAIQKKWAAFIKKANKTLLKAFEKTPINFPLFCKTKREKNVKQKSLQKPTKRNT